MSQKVDEQIDLEILNRIFEGKKVSIAHLFCNYNQKRDDRTGICKTFCRCLDGRVSLELTDGSSWSLYPPQSMTDTSVEGRVDKFLVGSLKVELV